MHNVEYSKSKVIKYLAWTFGLAYVIQVGAAYVCNNVNAVFGRLIIAAMMFVPAIGVLLSGNSLRDMGWKPQIRKNIKNILIAWFSPIVLTAVGALLYFLIFPGHFDISGEYLTVSAGPEVLKQMEEQGVTYSMYIAINAVAATTYAPLINMIPALGEEIGWRGFLYPQLKTRFGRKKGYLLGGFIWGAWHWPLIWLIGYEYGASAANPSGYVGFPISGMLVFSIVTTGLGIMHARLYEKSESIWLPALFHGAFNAAATLPLSICLTNTGNARLLGPASNGIIAALPFLIIGAVMLEEGDK